MKKDRIDEIQKKYGTGKYKENAEKTKFQIEEAEYKYNALQKINKKSFKERIQAPFLRLYIILAFMIATIIICVVFENSELDKFNSSLIVDHKTEELNFPIIIKYRGEIAVDKEKLNESTVYLSLEDVRKYLNPSLLYNEKEEQIILNGKSDLIELILDKDEININGIKTKLENVVFKENGNIYLPLNNICEYLGYDLLVSENFNVLLDSKTKEVKNVKLKEDVFLKKEKGLLANNIIQLSKDETYILVEEDAKYIKIRTKTGIYGYVNKKDVQNIVVLNKEYKEDDRINYHFILNYSDPGMNYDFVQKNTEKQNAVIVDMFDISKNKDGVFEINTKFKKDDESFKIYLNKIIVQEKMDVFAKLKVPKNIKFGIETFEERLDIIKKINQKMIEYDFKNILVELEEVNDPAAYCRFLIELKSTINNTSKRTLAVNNLDILKTDILKEVIDYYIDLNR